MSRCKWRWRRDLARLSHKQRLLLRIQRLTLLLLSPVSVQSAGLVFWGYKCDGGQYPIGNAPGCGCAPALLELSRDVVSIHPTLVMNMYTGESNVNFAVLKSNANGSVRHVGPKRRHRKRLGLDAHICRPIAALPRARGLGVGREDRSA